MFKDVYHIGYRTPDKDAAIAFYKEALGAELKLEATNADGAKLAFLRIGSTVVELIEPPDVADLRGGPLLVLDHVGYVVDSVEAGLAELEAKGMKRQFVRTNAEGARLAYIEPSTANGLKFHLTERPK
jgi:catechol 2,3-dioxygenase-like lactoylglutathione lyase family enzyme